MSVSFRFYNILGSEHRAELRVHVNNGFAIFLCDPEQFPDLTSQTLVRAEITCPPVLLLMYRK